MTSKIIGRDKGEEESLFNLHIQGFLCTHYGRGHLYGHRDHDFSKAQTVQHSAVGLCLKLDRSQNIEEWEVYELLIDCQQIWVWVPPINPGVCVEGIPPIGWIFEKHVITILSSLILNFSPLSGLSSSRNFILEFCPDPTPWHPLKGSFYQTVPGHLNSPTMGISYLARLPRSCCLPPPPHHCPQKSLLLPPLYTTGATLLLKSMCFLSCFLQTHF